ncbi:MAG: class II glutamine amidotransferase [Myxococcales bacterium]|nr:class II glutamine amidotransferase [Myxococcales bacterium]
MTRLFGVTCNEPERLPCALHSARAALTADTAPHGWGLGFYQGGEVLLQRHPKPAGRVDFHGVLTSLKAEYAIGHVREAGFPAKLENTQPFRFRQWVFAHSGALADSDLLRGSLSSAIPDFLCRNIRGGTDSELIFHLVLSYLHDAGRIDDSGLPAAEAGRALADAVRAVQRFAAQAGAAPPGLDLVLTNGRILLAVRSGRPMWWRRTNGLADCAPCREQARRPVAHEHLRAILVVGDPAVIEPGLGWEELPDGTLLQVTRDLQVSAASLARAS